MDDNDPYSFILDNILTKQKHDPEDFVWADSCLIEDPEISETNMDSIEQALFQILDQHVEINGASANEHGNSNDKTDPDENDPEDFAWADSCLIEDPEISETNMDSIKQALLQILDQHVEINGASANEHGNSNDKNDPENSHLVTVEELASHAADKSVDQDLEQENYDALSILKKQPFLPNFHDEMMNIQYSDDVDDDADFLVSEFVTKPLPDEDIFKVWDLDIAVEEDELDKQLKEALSSDAKTSESVDSLVESIAGLSIK